MLGSAAACCAEHAVLQHTLEQICCTALCCAVLCWLQSLQLSGLRVLSSLAAGAAEGELPGEVLVPTSLLDRLLDLIREPATHQEVSHGAQLPCRACVVPCGSFL
jgi:hypothetical protein